MALTFVANVSAPAGTPLHVSVYESGMLLDSTASPVTWSGLVAAITVAADPPGGGGYVFSGTAVASANVTAHLGVALGTLLVSFTAPPLQFTSP